MSPMPKHYFPSGRGAPILPAARRRELGLRLSATTPDEFTVPARRPTIPHEPDAVRNVVLFHLVDGELLGEDPGTIRRVVQVDLDRDLDEHWFETLVDQWPRLGYFPNAAARDEWLRSLDALLGLDHDMKVTDQ